LSRTELSPACPASSAGQAVLNRKKTVPMEH
jgi:hypothetical protein